MKALAPAAVAALFALTLPAPAAAGFDKASPADCALYETAYAAAAPLLSEARIRPGRPSVFATLALGRAHKPNRGGAGDLPGGELGPIVDLAGCPALVAKVEASGAPVKFVRPPVLRQVDGPYIESFSRSVTRDGKVHITYFVDRDQGVDVRLRREGDGWVVEEASSWETIIIT